MRIIQDARQQQQQQLQQRQTLQPPSGHSSNYDMHQEKEEVLRMFTEAWDRFMSKGSVSRRRQHTNRVADVQQQGAPHHQLQV